jgi:Flp pilus assembly protein TadB
MDDRIRMSNTWLIIISVGIVLFSYGVNSNKLFLEGLGALATVGALFCGISGVVIRLIRRKRGQRFK